MKCHNLMKNNTIGQESPKSIIVTETKSKFEKEVKLTALQIFDLKV